MRVYAFYDAEFSFKTLFQNHPDLRYDLTDCLIGHVERDYSKLRQALGELTELPDPNAESTLGVPKRAHHTDHTGHR